MNMIGMKSFISAVNSAGVTGGRSNNPQKNKEEDFYKECYDIIKECSQMPGMAGQIMPVTNGTKKEIRKANKGKGTVETHEIFFHQTNKSGIRFNNFETHLGGCRAIGMIDNDKLFVYNTLNETLTIVSLVELYKDKLGFCKEGANLLSEEPNAEHNEVSLKTVYIKGIDIRTSNSIINKDKNSPEDNWIKVANIMKAEKAAVLAKNTEAQIEA